MHNNEGGRICRSTCTKRPTPRSPGLPSSRIHRTELKPWAVQACEAVGGKLVGGLYCFGEYDVVFICDVPNNESMSAIALAVAAGGALKSGKTTVLMTGAEGVGSMRKADAVAKAYKPAR